MRDRLKHSFDQVQASERLKRSTQAYLFRRTKGYTQTYRHHPARWAAAAAALLFVIGLGIGSWLYFTPTSTIHIDINPSLELGVNRFGQVVDVSGANPEGRQLAENVELRFIGYTQAIETLLADETIQVYMEQGRKMSIVVVCDDARQSEEMLANLENCTRGRHNVSCHAGTETGHHNNHASNGSDSNDSNNSISSTDSQQEESTGTPHRKRQHGKNHH